jgi:hypothetical protein
MTPLEQLQRTATALSQHRDDLRAELLLLDAEVTAAKAAHMKAIHTITRRLVKSQAELSAGILANPKLFTRPRTFITEGVKFGLRKQVGKMHWDDDAKLLNRLDDLFHKNEISREKYDMAVETKYNLVSKGLEQLDAKLIKRLGITIEADSDAVEIKSVDGEVEKMVKAIIKDAAQDAANDAALAVDQERA